ncbi:MAG TPA: HAD family hydrolase [Polyangiaceae bacterium]|jgi:HAD superfamily hydrolase (TIGR01490 family)|nr:HAD family hydrolase [Polyangiaceae bacterium]
MNLALFDFDNTITTRDTFIPFLRLSAGPLRFFLGSVLLGPLFVGYKLGLVSAARMRVASSFACFVGRSASTVNEQGRRYAVGFEACLRPEARERLRFHREKGDLIVVVSASLDAYLRPFCAEHGFDLICTELETRGDRLTGCVRGGDCSSDEKAHRVRERYRLETFPAVYAYGDSAEDDALLALAHHAFLGWS